MLSQQQKDRLLDVSTCYLADAIKALEYPVSVANGVKGLWENCPPCVGEAVNIRLGPIGETKSNTPLCKNALSQKGNGKIIVIDNNGYTEISCFNSILAEQAKAQSYSGVIINGVTRDILGYKKLGMPVYGKGAVVIGGDDELMEYENDVMLSFAEAQVCPNDIVVADENGVIFLPLEKVEDILSKAEELLQLKRRDL